MKKLAIVSTHPIQYYAPIFKLLTDRKIIDVKVFYTWGEDSIKEKFDPGFKKHIKWDLPLLEGYNYEFLENSAKDPGSHHFWGIKCNNIIQSINSYKPDAILVYGWSYFSHLQLLRKFKGKVPIIFRGDSNLLDSSSGWKQNLRSTILKWVYQHVDLALYVGSANKDYFLRYGLKENQLVFSPHSIDNSRFFKSREGEVSLLKKSLGIKENDITILFAGKFEAKKNPMILLQAFKEINKSQLQLLFVGNGHLESELKSYVANNNLTNVRFLDFQNQQTMPVIYQSCDLYCLPSQGPGETWGLAVNEAMAASKAVLVSDKVGCSKDLVHSSKNGYIFKSCNLEDLKQKLSLMSSDRTTLKHMGEQSYNLIQSWSFESQVQVMENTIIRCL